MKKHKKKERYHISTLGNIEELGRVASDTAAWITLYYKEQIQSIDTSHKVKGSNFFNDKIKWMKDAFYDVRPEGAEEMTVIMVAEYVVGWIIEDLKSGKISPTESLHQQLWLCVAKKNCVDTGRKEAASDAVGTSIGRQMIQLKRTTDRNENLAIQLRHFIGCVSVVGNDGAIYQYKVDKKDESIPYMKDLKNFGYVYLKPFSNQSDALEQIIKSRDLVRALTNADGDILTKFDDIVQMLETHLDMNNIPQSTITREAALQLAQVLREQKLLVDPNDLKTALEKSRQDIEYSIDVLIEEMQKKTNYYQISIDAIHEQFIEEAENSREAMRKDNEERYKQITQALDEQSNGIEKRLKEKLSHHMKEEEKRMQEEYNKIMRIVQAAKDESNQSLEQAKRAVKDGEMLVNKAVQAIEYAKRLTELTEQQRQGLQKTVEQCELSVERAILEQQQVYEKNILEVRTKVHNDMERAKQCVEESAAKAHDAAQESLEAASFVKNTRKAAREEIEMQRQERERILMEVKEIKKQSEQMIRMAHDAEKHAKRSADTSALSLERLEKQLKKMEAK